MLQIFSISNITIMPNFITKFLLQKYAPFLPTFSFFEPFWHENLVPFFAVVNQVFRLMFINMVKIYQIQISLTMTIPTISKI